MAGGVEMAPESDSRSGVAHIYAVTQQETGNTRGNADDG